MRLFASGLHREIASWCKIDEFQGHWEASMVSTLVRLCLLFSLVACSSASDSATPVHGTWVSSKTLGKRGSFELSVAGSGSVSGQLRMTGQPGLETAKPISGTIEENIVPGASSYEYLDLKGAGIGFSGTVFGTWGGDDSMIGHYTTTAGDAGDWYNVVPGGAADWAVDVALKTDYTIKDLAFDGSQLYAVAASSKAGANALNNLYAIDTTTGLLSLIVTAGCESPQGIASDGTSFWVTGRPARDSASFNGLCHFDASWQLLGQPVQLTTAAKTDTFATPSLGLGTPSAFTWGNGSLSALTGWLDRGSVFTIDGTGLATQTAETQSIRLSGWEYQNGSFWTTQMPAGGIWGKLINCAADGTTAGRVFSPESSMDAGAIAADGASLWVAFGTRLYHMTPRP